jgi:hypothetical protein
VFEFRAPHLLGTLPLEPRPRPDLSVPFFFFFNFSSTAALVSMESSGPGGGLCLGAAELSGLQHCYSQEKSLLQSLGDEVGV